MSVKLNELREDAISSLYKDLEACQAGSLEQLNVIKAIDILQRQHEEFELKNDELADKAYSDILEEAKSEEAKEEARKQRRADIAMKLLGVVIDVGVKAVGWMIISSMHTNSIVADSFGTLQKSGSFKLIPQNPDRV